MQSRQCRQARALLLLLALVCFATPSSRADEATREETVSPTTVTGRMQTRPGAPMEDDVEVAVHPAPTHLPIAPGSDARLPNDDLVLGIVHDGQAIAFPVRVLGNYEVVDTAIGDLPVAPTW